MGERNETINITPCPLCGGEHRYTLELDVSPILYIIFEGEPPSKRRRFTRIFSCPRGGKFQGSVTLIAHSNEQINDVRVKTVEDVQATDHD